MLTVAYVIFFGYLMIGLIVGILRTFALSTIIIASIAVFFALNIPFPYGLLVGWLIFAIGTSAMVEE